MEIYPKQAQYRFRPSFDIRAKFGKDLISRQQLYQRYKETLADKHRMDAISSEDGIAVPDSLARNYLKNKYNELLSKLTITTRAAIGPNKIARVYRHVMLNGVRYLYIPRATAKVLFDKGVIRSIDTMVPETRRVQFKMEIELFDNQKVVVDHLSTKVFTEELQNDGFASATLNMGAGYGKTFTVAGLIAKLGLPTLYITVRKKLQIQARDDLKLCFPESNIAITQGTTNAIALAETSDIVVMIIDSACRMESSFFAKFGFIVFDEVHMYCSEIRSQIFWKTNVRCVLGMSATTNEHRDKFDAVYHKHLGSPIFASQLPGFDNASVKFSGEVTIVRYSGDAEHTRDVRSPITGYIVFDEMLTQFITDANRNKLCVKMILDLLDDPTCERNIFAFSDRRDHLQTIGGLLSAEFTKRKLADTTMFAPELLTMQGGTSESELNRANTARIILTTYGYSGTGVSLPKMNTAVFMTPRRNGFKQICARVMRRTSDVNIVRKFIDIVDVETSIKSQLYERKAAYRFYEFKFAPDTVVSANLVSALVDHTSDDEYEPDGPDE